MIIDGRQIRAFKGSGSHNATKKGPDRSKYSPREEAETLTISVDRRHAQVFLANRRFYVQRDWWIWFFIGRLEVIVGAVLVPPVAVRVQG